MIIPLALIAFVVCPSSGVIQQTSNSDGGADISSITNHMNSLEHMVIDLRTEVKSSNSELESVKDELIAVKTELRSTTSELISVKDELRQLKTNNSFNTAHSKINVKFLVQLQHDMDTVGIGDTLRFDKEIVNDGDGYNFTTGIFTTPVSGLYFFWANILVHSSLSHMDIYLYCNGADIARGASYPGSGIYDDAVITHVTNLKTGDQVWYGKHAGSANQLKGDLFSSYGGLLLSSD